MYFSQPPNRSRACAFRRRRERDAFRARQRAQFGSERTAQPLECGQCIGTVPEIAAARVAHSPPPRDSDSNVQASTQTCVGSRLMRPSASRTTSFDPSIASKRCSATSSAFCAASASLSGQSQSNNCATGTGMPLAQARALSKANGFFAGLREDSSVMFHS